MKNRQEIPEINVGILSGKEISFTLNGSFNDKSGKPVPSGKWKAILAGSEIQVQQNDFKIIQASGFTQYPRNEKTSSFTLHAVTIGVGFHWQRREDEIFKGSLKLITEDGMITVINILSLEEYLKSVISSEMSATSSEELLKAHSVISRGWLLAQSEKRKALDSGSKKYNPDIRNENEIVRWYDREDHKSFDVCADDHCQRYQGITRASSPIVEKVIEFTSGEVLTFNGEICDTRYYKCCGGVTELFENVWEPVSHPYLTRVVDNPEKPEITVPDLTDEMDARKWILGSPDAFCNTDDKRVLSQVLNDYDQETKQFYRWNVRYSQAELSDIIKARTGMDFGTITDLTPLERGVSGRIIRLKITGTLKEMVIGKELEIRKALSMTHLYSSCFIVERIIESNETVFVLHGAGWGHGVGLCQIGAAVMGSKGYSYREILKHYFPGSILSKRY